MSDKESPGESLGLLAFPARLPLLTLLIALAATAFLGTRAVRIRADASPATVVPMRASGGLGEARIELDDAPAIVVGVFADDVFDPATLARIDELSSSLWHLDGVATVVGPTTLLSARRDDGGVRLQPLIKKLPKTDDGARKLRERVLAHPLARTVVARDGRAATLTIRLHSRAIEGDGIAALEEGVRGTIARLGGPETFAVVGLPLSTTVAARELEQELPRLLAASLAVVAASALLCLRSVGAALLTSLTVGIGVIWTLGLMELAGQRIGFATVVLPPLLALLGSAGPLILLARHGRERSGGGSSVAALAATVAHARLPLAMGALTTALGAGAFVLASIPALRSFGWCGAVGAASLLLATILVTLPAVALWPAAFLPGAAARGGEASSRRLESLGAWIGRNRTVVALLVLPLAAAAAWGATRVRSGAGHGAYFDRDSPLGDDEERIATAVAPVRTLTIAVRGYEPRMIARREVILALDELQKFIAQQPGVVATRSLLDYLALIQQAGQPGTPFSLPETQEGIDALLEIDPASLYDVVDANLSRARITVYTSLAEPAEIERLVDGVNAFASPKLLQRGFGTRSLFPRGVEVEPHGTIVALQLAARALPAELLRALARASGALLVVASLLFLSLRVGVAAVLLNLVAPLALFGVAGWTGLPLTVTSAALAPLVLGVAVGHTLHYLSSSAATADRRSDFGSALPADVVNVVGKPIAYAAAALVLGCLTLLASRVPALRSAGVLGAAACAAACAANVLVLATRLLTTRILTLSDLLLVRVGRPEEIALFAGLRPFQTKIVMLTGRLATAAPGDFITRRGEVKQELYVLLSGRADVRAGEGSPTIGTLARGEVIGEMGLVREQPRSADVVATEPTEYLVLDGSFLERLRRQYPRIAAIVFLNLSRILSDRLERTTARLAEVGNK